MQNAAVKVNKKPEDGDDAKSMFVAVRIRPLSEREKEAHHSSCTEVIDGTVVAIKKNGNAAEYLKSQNGSIHDYGFDAAFDESASQYDVYSKTTKPFLDYLLQGINVTVFAYGATGAGKTHTLMGNTRCDTASAHGEAGIIPNAICDLFALIENKRKTAAVGETYSLVMNYIEVYNEQVYDLIDTTGSTRKSLRVCEDQEKGIVAVQGATDKVVNSAEEVLDMLHYGNKNRSTEATMANSVSSRSHAVLQMYLKTTTSAKNGRGGECYTEAKLSLIDLAGSERASATNNRGVRLQEGANINKSLLALANCINALAAEKKTNVKYRDSKLTHLLKSSLEGNCKLVMIANINPSHMTFEDSHNTLKYANRAKNIKLNPTVITTSKDNSWLERETRLRSENTELRQRVEFLESLVAQLRQQVADGSSSSPMKSPVKPAANHDGEEQREVIRAHSPTRVRELKQAHINRLRRRSSAVIPTGEEIGYEENRAKVRKNRASMCADVLTSLLPLVGGTNNVCKSNGGTNSHSRYNDHEQEEKPWEGDESAEESDINIDSNVNSVTTESSARVTNLTISTSESAAGVGVGNSNNFGYSSSNSGNIPVSPRAGRKLPGQTPSKIPFTGRKRRLEETADAHMPAHSRTSSSESECDNSSGGGGITDLALGGVSSPWKNMFSDTMLADGLFSSAIKNPPVSAAGSKLPVSCKKQPRPQQQQQRMSPTPYGGNANDNDGTMAAAGGASNRRESVKRMKIEELPAAVNDDNDDAGETLMVQTQSHPSKSPQKSNRPTPVKSPMPTGTYSSMDNNANFSRSPLADISYSDYTSAHQSPAGSGAVADAEEREGENQPMQHQQSQPQAAANLVLHAGEINPFAFVEKSPATKSPNGLNGTIKDLILMPQAMQYDSNDALLFSPGVKEQNNKPTHKKRRGSLLPMPRGRVKVGVETADEEAEEEKEITQHSVPMATRRSSRLSCGGGSNVRIKPVANNIPTGTTASSRRKSVAPASSATCNKAAVNAINDENSVNGTKTTGGIMQKVQNMMR